VRLALDASDAPAPVTTAPAADDFMSFWLEVPSMTYAESLLRHRATAVRASALPVIERALAKVEANHNRFQALVFSLLRALALADRGEEAAALEVLAATVREAEPSGVVRPFLDRGPRLLPLLEALRSCDVPQGHLQLLLAAFEARPADRVVHVDMGTPAPGSSLSNRELDVLALLTQRLSNKEIAQRLHVSPETVKKHTRNLYMKLEVHGRREAVAKAVADRLVTVRS
jgi:LuxR family transcriptional regulator, maltose regulon positive regulatory protein